MSDSTRVSNEEIPISDDELTELALAADPEAPIDLDAQPWHFSTGLLAATPARVVHADTDGPRPRSGLQIAAVSVVVGMVVVCAFGLCITSGFLQLA